MILKFSPLGDPQQTNHFTFFNSAMFFHPTMIIFSLISFWGFFFFSFSTLKKISLFIKRFRKEKNEIRAEAHDDYLFRRYDSVIPQDVSSVVSFYVKWRRIKLINEK